METNPINILLLAEKAATAGNIIAALDLYDEAIVAAQKNKNRPHEAMACELAAAFCVTIGKNRFAEIYLRQAANLYAGKGISPGALPQPAQERQTVPSVTLLSSGAHHRLDLESLTKAVRAISGEIKLENLLIKILQVVVENAGAESGFLLLESGGGLRIQAAASAATGGPFFAVMQNMPMQESADLSEEAVLYVSRTSTPLILDDAAKTGRLSNTAYVQKNSVRSLYCAPILKQGNLQAVLYLENRLLAGVFTQERAAFLEMLAAQMAVSIDNALVYQNMEAIVAERTAEVQEQKNQLHRSFQDLQLLSEIGREITSHISVEAIIDAVYAEVNRLMPAEVFGIGIYNEIENQIDFPGVIEKGEKLPLYSKPLGSGDNLSDWCFKNKKEIVIQNFLLEAPAYLPKRTDWSPKIGDTPESIMYLPLLVKNKAIGNITVQSFVKNAYTQKHLDIFRNLALYTAIALDNASAYQKLSAEKEKTETQRQKSEKLLLNILPKETAEELKENGFAAPKRYEKASVLFTDFKGFTSIAEKMTPEEVVKNLDHCFRAFDKICRRYGLEKIKTIGDSYMAAAGIPTPDDDNPIRAVAAALKMIGFMQKWKAQKEAKNEMSWEIRIGIHTGPLVAGVVGEDKFAYDIWGDTVNMASRMESAGEAGQVNVSEATHAAIVEPQGLRFRSDAQNWQFEYRGKISAKGKGEVGMYFVKPG